MAVGLAGKEPRCCVCLSELGMAAAGWSFEGTCGLVEGPAFAVRSWGSGFCAVTLGGRQEQW